MKRFIHDNATELVLMVMVTFVTFMAVTALVGWRIGLAVCLLFLLGAPTMWCVIRYGFEFADFLVDLLRRLTK
jgi:hypothetical protein